MHCSTNRAVTTLLSFLAVALKVHATDGFIGFPDSTVFQTSTIVVATSTITITLASASSISVETVTMTTTSAMSQPTSTSTAGQQLVASATNSTNFFRQAYEANPLAWNSTLASYAQAYAEKCVWKHSGGPYGENLAAGYATVSDAIDAWAGEEAEYNWSKQGFSEDTGHFTQLVWKDTTSFGCGLVQCDGKGDGSVPGQYLVCEYYPPGNVEGQYNVNVGKKGVGKDGTLGMGGVGSVRESRSVAALAVAFLCMSVFISL